MGHGDYPLHEFAVRLAEVESRFAKELRAVVECFVQSRVDLPVKHLEDIGKNHSRKAKNLRKAVDQKKTDGVNLWKITNVYSAAAVDIDDSMREVRGALKKHIRKEAMKIKMNGEDVCKYRRVADDYRPLIAAQRNHEEQQTKGAQADRRSIAAMEVHSISSSSDRNTASTPSPTADIYDTNAPATIEEKQRWLEMWRAQVAEEERERREKPLPRRKIEKRQSMKIFGSTVSLGSLPNINFSNITTKIFGERNGPMKAPGTPGPQHRNSMQHEQTEHADAEKLRAELRTMKEKEVEREKIEQQPVIEPGPALCHSRIILPGSEEARLVMKF